MADAQVQAWLDQEDERVTQAIRKHGVFIQYVIGDKAAKVTSAAYTIGLFGLGHPELLVLGTDPGTAAGLLNEVAQQEVVPNPAEIVFGANRHSQRPPEASVPVLVLTYDDLGGRFPWEAGYANPEWIQPRPGAFSC